MAVDNPVCLCGDLQSQHRLGKRGCKVPDCGCDRFEAADDAAEKERVNRALIPVLEDNAERLRAELGQQSTSARLREVERELGEAREEADRRLNEALMAKLAVERERDEALGDAKRARGYWHTCSADRDRIKAELDRRVREVGDLAKRVDELEQLAEFTEQHVRDMQDAGVIPPVEIHGWDAWQCDTCGSRYRPFHDHPCGPLKPVRVSITERGATTA
jgi:hypothetical protein